MTEDEKLVMNLLKENSPLDLNELKEQTGLCNKKWDKAIKGLTKNKLARVEKTDEDLIVTLSQILTNPINSGITRNLGVILFSIL